MPGPALKQQREDNTQVLIAPCMDVFVKGTGWNHGFGSLASPFSHFSSNLESPLKSISNLKVTVHFLSLVRLLKISSIFNSETWMVMCLNKTQRNAMCLATASEKDLVDIMYLTLFKYCHGGANQTAYAIWEVARGVR